MPLTDRVFAPMVLPLAGLVLPKATPLVELLLNVDIAVSHMELKVVQCVRASRPLAAVRKVSLLQSLALVNFTGVG